MIDASCVLICSFLSASFTRIWKRTSWTVFKKYFLRYAPSLSIASIHDRFIWKLLSKMTSVDSFWWKSAETNKDFDPGSVKLSLSDIYSVFHIKLHQRKRCHLTLIHSRLILKIILFFFLQKDYSNFWSPNFIDLSWELCNLHQFKVIFRFWR